ncbi:hypothetical protein bsdtb5_08120 [Anaeromicropila herbilytica]|uniref:Uncharacterized protein n=1 Tax=Anaeromicropila herbilytica TaxID=2785025 RepID=A0A7R7EIQ3_9FIRM|nr:hypothetical protein bsdtb5_08120 [Anaeromicropila herbilytica]
MCFIISIIIDIYTKHLVAVIYYIQYSVIVCENIDKLLLISRALLKTSFINNLKEVFLCIFLERMRLDESNR